MGEMHGSEAERLQRDVQARGARLREPDTEDLQRRLPRIDSPRSRMMRSTASDADSAPVSRRSSGCSGSSYGDATPVSSASSPRAAFPYSPLGSRRFASSRGT